MLVGIASSPLGSEARQILFCNHETKYNGIY